MDLMQEDPSEEPTIPGCDDTLSTENCLHFSLIPAVLIVGVLSFLQRRTKKHAIDQRLPLLQGRFGIVIPMDAMGYSNRWSYGFAFGAISYSVLELFNEQHMPKVFPTWAKAIAWLLGAFEVGLAYFPFFACLSTSYKATGAVMGIFYSIFWITVVGWDWFTCPDGQEWGHYQKIIYQWPWMLSLIFLLGRFVYLLVKVLRKQCKAEEEVCEESLHAHQIDHVKRLLRKTAIYSKPLNWFQRHVYEWDPYFKFPNRLIGTAIISLLTLYTFILSDLGITSRIFESLDLFLYERSTSGNFVDVIRKCHHVTLVTASLNMVVYVCHVLACYRKHMKRLWKGQKDYLPKKLQNPSSAVCVASIAKYSGWQIAFTLWGYVIVRFVQFLVAILIYYGLIEPIINGNGLELLQTVGTLLVTFGLVILLFKLQVLLVQYFFLQDKISPTDDQKPLALNNRKAFYCFNYFFFFYNVMMGITTCFLRLMISFMLGTCLVSRIDRTIMQKGYETFDRGYRTWIGVLFADHYHNNPVMVCFCQLLLCHVKDVQHDSNYSILNHAPCDSENRRVKKRWTLLYTLLKNPHLIPLRKHHLSANVPLKLSSSPQADIVVRAWLMHSQAATEMVTEKC